MAAYIVAIFLLVSRGSDEIGQLYPVTRYWGSLRHSAGHGPVPALWHKFDWVVQPALLKIDHVAPQSIYCNPRMLSRCFQMICELDHASCTVVVIGGDDNRLSENLDVVLSLVARVRRVFYEAMDVAVPGVFAMPIALQEFYYREQPEAFGVIRRGKRDSADGVIAAWGAWWQLPNIKSRQSLKAFCREHSAANAWLTCSKVAKFEWWSKLSGVRFMLYPEGNGIQSPKQFEAFLVGSVPIALRNVAFEDLSAAGWPIVLVDRWEEVLVKENRDSWWRIYGKRLSVLKTRGLLTVAGFFAYLMQNGSVPSVITCRDLQLYCSQ